jgi:hypothetical protein
LENLGGDVDISRVWETIRENINISRKMSLRYYELNKHNTRFDEGCSKISDRKIKAKLQRLQDPNQIKEDNRNNIRRESSRHFRNREREYLKGKIDELLTNSKEKNIRDLCRGIIFIIKSLQLFVGP